MTEAIICNKALAIYTDLSQQIPALVRTSHRACNFKLVGACLRILKRPGIQPLVRHVEAVIQDVKTAEDYLKTFAGIVAAEGYIPQQIFNCDETVQRDEADVRPQTSER